MRERQTDRERDRWAGGRGDVGDRGWGWGVGGGGVRGVSEKTDRQRGAQKKVGFSIGIVFFAGHPI